MQIPSSPATATTPLQVAGRPVVGATALETRSNVLPAVQQPSETQSSIDRRNPANRPTLVDEEVRLYGPFAQSGAAEAEPVASEVPDVVVDDQPQGQQSQQQASDEAAADAEAAAANDGESATTDGTDDAGAEADRRPRAAGDGSPAQGKAETRQARIEAAEKEQIARLAARDREVRAHEAAHASIGGQYAGAASFAIRQGPNGVNYAVSGEVPIDVSAIPDDPEATLRKMQTVQRAALAPAEPSAADRAVAAQAAQIAQQARSQLLAEQTAERASKTEQAREARAEAAQRRAGISERLAAIQSRFDFSATLVEAQRSRQIDIVAERYSPLRPSAIGTLLDETV